MVNFPTSLDTTRNPSVKPGQTGYNADDAIAALEAKVGINGSAVTSSLDYQVNDQVRAWVAKTNTTDQTGITTQVDITGLSVTFTADSSRMYKFTLNVNVNKTSSTNFASVYITDTSNVVAVARSEWMAAGDYRNVQLVWTETGLSGSVTRKGRIDSTGGVSVINSFSRQGILLVEDIGPS